MINKLEFIFTKLENRNQNRTSAKIILTVILELDDVIICL